MYQNFEGISDVGCVFDKQSQKHQESNLLTAVLLLHAQIVTLKGIKITGSPFHTKFILLKYIGIHAE